MCLSSRINHQHVCHCFAVDPTPLLLHKGKDKLWDARNVQDALGMEGMQPVWVLSLLVQQKTVCAIRAGKVLLLAVIRDVIAKHYLTELEPIQSHTSSVANCARR